MTGLGVFWVVTTGLVSLFTFLFLLIAAGSYAQIETRVSKVAESQRDLAESQVRLSEVFSEVMTAFGKLADEHEELKEKYEFLVNAQKQQTVLNLRHQLLTLLNGDREDVTQRIELEQTANPGKPEEWYLKKVIFEIRQASKATSRK